MGTLLILALLHGAPDAGAQLSRADCAQLLDHMALVAVNEALARDPQLAKLSPVERASVERRARREALAQPQLEALKAACPTRYSKAAESCVLAAGTMEAIDACAARR